MTRNRSWQTQWCSMACAIASLLFFAPSAQAATETGAPTAAAPVVAPGAPTFLIEMARKRTFAPCRKPPSGMLCIPGGIYVRGSNRNAQHPLAQMRAESPRHYVILDTYYIDTHEVTHAQFKQCLLANRCQPSKFRTYPGHWRYDRFGTPKRPFLSATWFHARDYCAFIGKRLLTEAEWEAAARGPNGYTFPWGNEAPSCKKANYRYFPAQGAYPKSSTMRFCPHPSEDPKTIRTAPRQDQTWEVGSTPPYRGIYDMAGNGYEWVQDVYDPNAHAGCNQPGSPTCQYVNPAGPCGNKLRCSVKQTHVWIWQRRKANGNKGRPQWTRKLIKLRRPKTITYSRHILKGGSWWWFADRMRGAHRRSSQPYTGMHRLSIRCGSSTTALQPLSPKLIPAIRKPRLRKKRR